MAQLSDLLETGLISVLFSSIGTGIILFLAQRGLKQRIFDNLYEFIGSFSANKDNPEIKAVIEPISGLFQEMALNFVSKMLLEVKDNPQKFIALVKPAINVLIEDFMKDMPKGAQEALATGGISAITPLLPPKLRKYAGLLQMFGNFGGGTQSGNPSTSQSPFSSGKT